MHKNEIQNSKVFIFMHTLSSCMRLCHHKRREEKRERFFMYVWMRHAWMCECMWWCMIKLSRDIIRCYIRYYVFIVFFCYKWKEISLEVKKCYSIIHSCLSYDEWSAPSKDTTSMTGGYGLYCVSGIQSCYVTLPKCFHGESCLTQLMASCFEQLESAPQWMLV